MTVYLVTWTEFGRGDEPIASPPSTQPRTARAVGVFGVSGLGAAWLGAAGRGVARPPRLLLTPRDHDHADTVLASVIGDVSRERVEVQVELNRRADEARWRDIEALLAEIRPPVTA